MKRSDPSYLLVDVRTELERELAVIPNSTSVPLMYIKDGSKIKYIKDLLKGRKLILHCKKGPRAIQAIDELSKYNLDAVNLEGGIEEWSIKIDNSVPIY